MIRGPIPWSLDTDDLPGPVDEHHPPVPPVCRLPVYPCMPGWVWSSLPMDAPGHPEPHEPTPRYAGQRSAA